MLGFCETVVGGGECLLLQEGSGVAKRVSAYSRMWPAVGYYCGLLPLGVFPGVLFVGCLTLGVCRLTIERLGLGTPVPWRGWGFSWF